MPKQTELDYSTMSNEDLRAEIHSLTEELFAIGVRKTQIEYDIEKAADELAKR